MEPTRASRIVAGRYKLAERIGRGGTATVWSATDLVDGSPVALKWLRRRAAPGPLARREIATLRLLQIPGVVVLRDEGVDRGRAYIVMEQAAGRPFPGCSAPCPWSAVEGPLVTLLEVLERIHAMGVIHRDLKPENVLVQGGRSVVLDFGVARFGQPDAPAVNDVTERWGTPAYMAPELWRGEDDPRSDLFSVGVMMHYALTGRFPFAGRRRGGGVFAEQNGRPRTAWHCAIDAPALAFALCERLIAWRTCDRPESAREALRQLNGPTSARGVAPPQQLPGRGVCSEDQLRELFCGPDRLLHLRQDAARILHARTGGDVARVARELSAWERAGIARRVGDLFAVSRGDLDRLMSEMLPVRFIGHHDDVAARVRYLPDDARALAEWLALAGAPMSTAALTRAIEWPVSRVRRAAAVLRLSGLIRRVSRGWILESSASVAPPGWPPARRAVAHHQLARALPRGAPGRLVHLLAAPPLADEITTEIHGIAHWLAVRGHLSQAEQLLLAGVRVLRTCPAVTDRHFGALFTLCARVAIEQWTVHALDRLHCELSTLVSRSPDMAALARLVHSAQSTLHWTPNALGLLRRTPRFTDPERELLRHEVRVIAARRVSPEALRRAVGGLQRLAGAHPGWRRRLASWHGRLAYVEERYEDASQWHLRAARGEPWVSRRHRALLDAAAALMEIGRFDSATHCAETVRREAEALRLPAVEGRAIWAIRTLRWRSGVVDAPEPAWVDAAREVDPELTRLAAFHEAVLAWRDRDISLFRRMLAQARVAEGQVSEHLSNSLLEAMAVDLGLQAADEHRVSESVAKASKIVPGIALQIAALTHDGSSLTEGKKASFGSFAHSVPAAYWGFCLDVLSVHECLSRLGMKEHDAMTDSDSFIDAALQPCLRRPRSGSPRKIRALFEDAPRR